MIKFEYENEGSAEPSLPAKLITVAGLLIFWIWVAVLIF